MCDDYNIIQFYLLSKIMNNKWMVSIFNSDLSKKFMALLFMCINRFLTIIYKNKRLKMFCYYILRKVDRFFF